MCGREEKPALVLVVGDDSFAERVSTALRLLDRSDLRVEVLVAERKLDDLAAITQPTTLSTFVISGGHYQLEVRDRVGRRRDYQSDHGAVAAARNHYRQPRPRLIDRKPKRRCQPLPGCR